MTITQFELARIAGQASSLFESLSNGWFKVDTLQLNEEQVSNDRLNHWCQTITQGNWEKFQQRLQWDGLDLNTLRLTIGTIPLADSQNLPTWAETLREIIQTASDLTFENESKILIAPENPLPFEEILLPALSVARQKLLTCLGLVSLSPGYLPLELLSEQAYLSLKHNLLQRLTKLCEKTLYFEFSHFLPLGHNLLNLIGETKDSKSKVHYNAFVQKLLQDGLLSFFQKYPVLGRLVATRIDFWVEATAEFLQRLKADISVIGQIFAHLEQSENQLGKVVEIKPSLSDPHNRGRSVIALTFESGLKLIYKPKDLSLEVAYTEFLDWCNQHGIPLTFKVLKVLARQDYGWVEYVEQLPCQDRAAAQHFYQRAGMLLCLLYTLGGIDCHQENLIASGEHLVLVDMETLMHHEPRFMEDSPESTKVETGAIQHLWDSVLRTGLLPRWDFSKDNRIAYDVSGLGSVDPQQAPSRVSHWKSINTDDMHLGYETVTMSVQKNVPTLNEVVLSPNDYLEEFVEGFRQMYCFLINQREALLADDGPLAGLQEQQVRFVFRATKVYGVVLQKTLTPEFLRNGIDRSIELDILSRAFLLVAQDKPDAWPILHSELRAMEQLDIPYFRANSNSDALTVGLEQSIAKFFQEPSYSQIISRLKKLNEIDLAQQVAIIQGSFYARVARTPRTDFTSEFNQSTFKEADFSQIIPLSCEQLLHEASFIAQEIQKRAVSTPSGSVNWIGLGYVANAERFQLQPLGNNLYDGICGIALFLAALDRVRDSAQFRNLTLGALQSLRGFLQTSDAEFNLRFARATGLGGATGLGSIVYSLVKISHFLEESALLEDAQQAANLITPEITLTDQEFDVMQGAAGAILGLLALYHETAESAVLDKAVTCGQHLIEHRVSVDDATKAWKTFGDTSLTGFSHGAAGIAYALLRLYEVTQDSAYLEAAKEGIAYESSVFSKTAANWPDFRSFGKQNSQPGYMVSWCHGAPGIGLGRLGGLSILETEAIHQDVEVALQTTQKYGLQTVDNLCCGNFGRIEMLLVASQKLSRPQLRETAGARAAWLVASAEQTGAYKLFPNLPSHVFSPSFFQGTAGIGYELLRLAHPELLPSVLLWE
jgi:type 2 lantibiotic biosynthesis protein LanM